MRGEGRRNLRPSGRSCDPATVGTRPRAAPMARPDGRGLPRSASAAAGRAVSESAGARIAQQRSPPAVSPGSESAGARIGNLVCRRQPRQDQALYSSTPPAAHERASAAQPGLAVCSSRSFSRLSSGRGILPARLFLPAGPTPLNSFIGSCSISRFAAGNRSAGISHRASTGEQLIDVGADPCVILGRKSFFAPASARWSFLTGRRRHS